jgi:glycosyltransferase involved in cell wall biosynthesis
MSTGIQVACLLPARNCAEDLPGWFESVARVADAVVALDDGSTDATRTILAGHPLVRRLLVNPVRASYEGWDDGANRARLLDAAAGLSPAWIISLDADERIPADDAAALRRFLRTAADPSRAYLLTRYRMVGDLDHFDAGRPFLVGRLFAFEPGQRMPRERLHFVPIPTSIPSTRWVRTTLRIQHLAGLTPERQRARVAKYREADPGRRFGRRYGPLLRPPADVQRWPPRPPELPVVTNRDAPAEAGGAGEPGAPLLSAIVIARDDEARIARAVASVVRQRVPAPFEVIVVTSGTDRTADLVRARFPSVRVVELPRPALPGEARNAGLAVARGRYASFPGSHVELAEGSLAARLEAHRRGYAMVTGTALNGTPTRAGWAAYFLDHAPALPGRPSGPLDEPPVSCSYLRAALEHVGGFPAGWRAGEDTLVNTTLFRLGYGAWRVQDLRFRHHTPCATVPRLVRHHWHRGQAFARVLLAPGDAGERHVVRRRLWLLACYVPGRVLWVWRRVRWWGGPELRREWRRAWPLAVLAVTVSWLGTWDGLIRAGWWRLRRGGRDRAPDTSAGVAGRA